jgi:hypothetical protein
MMLRPLRVAFFGLLACLAIWLVVEACVEEAAAMNVPHIISLQLLYPQAPDSARIAMTWTSRQLRPGELPIGYFETRIIEVTAGDTLARGVADRFARADTLQLAWPAPRDTILIQALVGAVDTEGQLGNWGRSRAVHFGVGVLPPSAPDSVGIFQLDSIPMSLDVREVHVRPTYLYVAEGEHRQLCAILVLHNDSTGFVAEYADGTPYADSTTIYCQGVYDAWLLERVI